MSDQRDMIAARWYLAMQDPCYFARWFCFTLDQHDRQQPIKPFPVKRHLVALTRLWQDNPMLFIAKSRQMMVSWWAAMLAAWEPLARKGRLIYLQSKRLEDVVGNEDTGDGLLGRAKFILRHIPFQDWLPLPRRWQDGILGESVTFPWMASSITPIAQGGDKIRSHTVSGLISDETAFQDEFANAYMASVASIRRGWFVGITTPDMRDGGQSMRIAKDQADPT